VKSPEKQATQGARRQVCRVMASYGRQPKLTFNQGVVGSSPTALTISVWTARTSVEYPRSCLRGARSSPTAGHGKVGPGVFARLGSVLRIR